MIELSDLLKCKSVQSHNINDFETMNDVIISTDSRKLGGANTFVALYGENFNANNFIDDVINQNVNVVIYCEKKESFNPKEIVNSKIKFIQVSDTYDFILELAEVVSKKWQDLGGLMIGITGSNGKTTNKEILFHLFNSLFPGEVHKTAGNLNNNIGVPLTLFALKKSHKICIVEMGMNHRGEIYPLAKAAKPNVGMITSIGPAHLEHLKTIENIFEEKKELYNWVSEHGDSNKLFIVRDNDEYLKKITPSSWCYHLSKDNFVNNETSFTLVFNNKRHDIKNTNLSGKHHQDNLAQCLFMALKLFPEKESKLVKACKNFSMPQMNRGVIKKVENTLIYLDAYNANPASMRASLSSFFIECQKHDIAASQSLVILGDMNELGEESASMHKKLGEELLNYPDITAYFVGRYANDYEKGFSGKSKIFSTAKEVAEHYKKALKTHKAIFIKGSRSLQLESILDINV